jgi:PKD repeat protein
LSLPVLPRRTKVHHPRTSLKPLVESLEQRQLLAFTIAEGTGTGLTGTYFDDPEFTGPSVTRIDPVVDFDLGLGSPHPSIDPEFFSVVWTGQVQARFTEPYELITRSDDGVRLYLNGQLVIDNWTDHMPVEDRSGPLPLVAGQKYDVRMEWYERGGGATAQLMWSGPSTPQQIIPQTQLYPSADPGDGPTVFLTGHNGRYENQSVQVYATASGGQGPYSFSWVTHLNGELYSLSTGSSFEGTIPDDGIFEIMFTATDAAGETGSATWVVVAEEAAPRLGISGPAYVNEGEEFEVQLSKSDAQEDHVEWWHIDWGDGSDPDGDGRVGQFAYGETATLKHIYHDEGQYTVSYTMKDKEGIHSPLHGERYRLTDTTGTWQQAEDEAVSLGGHLVAINDEAEHGLLIQRFLSENPHAAAYWIGLTDADAYATEGNYVWTTGEPLTYADWNTETGEPNNYWGPGSEDYVAMNFQTWFGHPGHVGSWNDMPADQYPFRGIVELPVSPPLVITVADTELEVDLSGAPETSPEGTGIGLVSGAADAVAEIEWTITKDGEYFATAYRSTLWFVPEEDGLYVITVVATNEHQQVSDSATIRVTNVAPQIESIGGPSVMMPGDSAAFDVEFGDPGTLDTHAVSWDFGDGTVTDFVPVEYGYSVTSPEHAYDRTGTYTVTVHVRDDDGGVSSATRTVTVEAVRVLPDPADPRVQMLVVAGTDDVDVIHVANATNGQLVVTMNGRRYAAPTGTNPEKVVVFARGGDDRVRVVGSVAVPIEVYAGGGDDDVIGGPAGDILVGGAGRDKLMGGRGRDVLIGGAGRDQLHGLQDEDVLLGEATIYDAGPIALRSIRAEWIRTDQTAGQRRHHLTAGGGLNDPFRLDAGSIVNDGETDALHGSSSEDWLFGASTKVRAKTARRAAPAVKIRR